MKVLEIKNRDEFIQYFDDYGTHVAVMVGDFHSIRRLVIFVNI
jgi:hypothetical protein